MGKRGKIKKSHLKRFASDYINVTARPRFLILDDIKNPNERWFDNHGRVRSTTGPKNNKSVVLNNTFMQAIPETIKPKQKATVDTRTTLEIVQQVWRDTFHQGVNEFHHVDILNHGQWLNRHFFCGDKHFIACQKDKHVRVSKIYRDKEIMMDHYRNKKLIWDCSFDLD